MKLLKHGLPVLLLAAGAGFTSTASAALFDRGGGMIYDDVLNITWLANPNLGASSSYDDGANPTDGLMTWGNAVAWASNLTYGGASDWRLPVMTDIISPGCNFSLSGGTDCGFNVKTKQTGAEPTPGSPFVPIAGTPYSEMAYLWIDELALGANPAVSLFSSIAGAYWFMNADATDATAAWGFDFSGNFQSIALKTAENGAWAVRSGDIANVPEPGSMMLLSAGLMGWLGTRVRRRA